MKPLHLETMGRNGSNGAPLSLKMIVLGDKYVGKTTLCNAFTAACDVTVGDDGSMMSSPRNMALSQGINDMVLCVLDTVEYGSVQIKLWDTVGEEYSGPTNNVYRDANGIVLMYDVTKRETFENIERLWIPRIRSLLGDGGTSDDNDADERDLLMRDHIFKLLIVANKTDLPADQRRVSEQEAQLLTQRLRVPYVQLSSLDRHRDIVKLPFILLLQLLAPLIINSGGSASSRRSLLPHGSGSGGGGGGGMGDLTAFQTTSSVASTGCC